MAPAGSVSLGPAPAGPRETAATYWPFLSCLDHGFVIRSLGSSGQTALMLLVGALEGQTTGLGGSVLFGGGVRSALPVQAHNLQSLIHLSLVVVGGAVLPTCLCTLFWSRYNRTGLLRTVHVVWPAPSTSMFPPRPSPAVRLRSCLLSTSPGSPSGPGD